MVMGDIKFAVCLSVCLSVCLGRISSKTAERTWLKFYSETEVCSGHCVSHFGGDRPRGPDRGAENVFFRSTAIIFHLIRQMAPTVNDVKYTSFIFVR